MNSYRKGLSPVARPAWEAFARDADVAREPNHVAFASAYGPTTLERGHQKQILTSEMQIKVTFPYTHTIIITTRDTINKQDGIKETGRG